MQKEVDVVSANFVPDLLILWVYTDFFCTILRILVKRSVELEKCRVGEVQGKRSVE